MFVHIQDKQKNGRTAATTIVSPSLTVTAGSLLVVAAVSFTQTPNITSVKLDGATSFTVDLNITDATTGYRLIIASLPNVAAGAHTVTATYGATITDGNLWVSEFSGGATVTPVDGTGHSGTGSSAAPSAGAVTASAATDLYYAIFGDDASGTNTVAAGTNYTLAGTAVTNGAANIQSGAEYRIQTTLTTDTPTFALGSSHAWVAAGIAYKVAAGGTQFTQSLTGGLSFTGAYNLLTTSHQAGSLSFVGTSKRSISKLTSAALSFSGAVKRFTTKGPLTAALGFTGNIAKRSTRTLTAALSFAGSFTTSKVFIKALTAALSFTGSQSKRTQKVLTASLGFVGAIARRIAKTISSVLDFVADFAFVPPASHAQPRVIDLLASNAHTALFGSTVTYDLLAEVPATLTLEASITSRSLTASLDSPETLLASGSTFSLLAADD